MSTTSFDSTWTFGATRIAVPIGATAAVFMQPIQGQIGWILKTMPGQTAEIYPCAIGSSVLGLNFGTTQTQAFLAGLSQQGFLLGGATASVENFKIYGPATFYLGNSSGATILVYAMMLKGQGY